MYPVSFITSLYPTHQVVLEAIDNFWLEQAEDQTPRLPLGNRDVYPKSYQPHLDVRQR